MMAVTNRHKLVKDSGGKQISKILKKLQKLEFTIERTMVMKTKKEQ